MMRILQKLKNGSKNIIKTFKKNNMVEITKFITVPTLGT